MKTDPRGRWGRMLAVALLLGLVPGAGLARDAAREEAPRFPRTVKSVDGRSIDVAALAKEQRVVVVTLKATWCRVCQEQLRRIRAALPDPGACGVTFLVLAPGPARDLKAIQRDTKFAYPFIEDRGLAIAGALGLRLSREEIMPAILILEPDLRVGWMQRGRNAASYGDPKLLEEVRCTGWI